MWGDIVETKPNNGGEEQPIDKEGKYRSPVGKALDKKVSEIKKVDEKKVNELGGDRTQYAPSPEGYIEKNGRPVDYDDPINKYKRDKEGNIDVYKRKSGEHLKGDPKVKEDVLSQLKDYYEKALLIANNRFVDFDSFVEAYKNYQLNEKEYGRSAFMQMIKRQTDEGLKKRYAERNRDKFNSLLNGNKDPIGVVNNYRQGINQDLTDRATKIKEDIGNNKKEIKQLEKDISSGKLSPLDLANAKARRRQLLMANKRSEKEIANLKSKLMPMLRNTTELYKLYRDNPHETLAMLEQKIRIKKPKLSEEQKAMNLLLGTIGGTK